MKNFHEFSMTQYLDPQSLTSKSKLKVFVGLNFFYRYFSSESSNCHSQTSKNYAVLVCHLLFFHKAILSQQVHAKSHSELSRERIFLLCEHKNVVAVWVSIAAWRRWFGLSFGSYGTAETPQNSSSSLPQIY